MRGASTSICQVCLSGAAVAPILLAWELNCSTTWLAGMALPPMENALPPAFTTDVLPDAMLATATLYDTSGSAPVAWSIFTQLSTRPMCRSPTSTPTRRAVASVTSRPGETTDLVSTYPSLIESAAVTSGPVLLVPVALRRDVQSVTALRPTPLPPSSTLPDVPRPASGLLLRVSVGFWKPPPGPISKTPSSTTSSA